MKIYWHINKENNEHMSGSKSKSKKTLFQVGTVKQIKY